MSQKPTGPGAPIAALPNFVLPGVESVDFGEPDSIAPRRNAKANEEAAQYDAMVRTAPRDGRVLKLYVPAEKAKGTSTRIGRAITRLKLRDVFVTGSAIETKDGPNKGKSYAYIYAPKDGVKVKATK